MSGKNLPYKTIEAWQLPEGECLLERVERMVEPALWQGVFGGSATLIVCGLQYHLGGKEDTRALAELAHVSAKDKVLDVCCFLGGPALQLTISYGCHVTGIDLSERCIAGAKKIAQLAGMQDSLDYQVANATDLPFADETFGVVWNQASLDHDDAWLDEFDRVLAPGGRLALTSEIAPEGPNAANFRWSLPELARQVRRRGYRIEHLQDLAAREIDAWQSLQEKLSAREEEFVAALGVRWVRQAREEFAHEIDLMRRGCWSNGRLVATKQ